VRSGKGIILGQDETNEARRALLSEPVFFPSAVPSSLAEIAACAGAAVQPGADLSQIITGAAPPAEALPGELTFLDSPQDRGLLAASRAAACFVTPDQAAFLPETTLALIVDEPSLGFARAMRLLFPQATGPASLFGTAGVNPGATIHPEARLEQDVIVDPGAVIGPRAEIGSGSIIGANSVIGAGVRIGRNCRIGPQVTISHALIGDRVIVHPGVRIGQPAVSQGKPGKSLPSLNEARIPALGRVILQDGVEIGANATLDRGTITDTVLGEGTRVGSLVQIAGDVMLGRFCAIPAQVHIPARVRRPDFFFDFPK
jgi:UDP-3-O-[3-hydroxymyristoyl] glucosamine N-acyltransferase